MFYFTQKTLFQSLVKDNKTPEPTFVNEPRYNPPDTPKKSPKPSPVKSEPNPMLKLAVPRSARSRKISFKDENDKKKSEHPKQSNIESDLSDDEAEQDEILSLDVESKTYTQEVRETHAVVTCKSSNVPSVNNTCTDLVPLTPATTKSSVSSTALVPIETVEIKPLALSKYPPSWSTSVTPSSRISVTTANANQSYNFSGKLLITIKHGL